MSKHKKGKAAKGKGNAGGKPGGKQLFECDEQEMEIFNTFKMLSEEIEKPDMNYYNTDDEYEFRIISTNWLKKLESHTKGLEPMPSEMVNADLLDETKHNDTDKVFKWNKRRRFYDTILKKKLKFKKDFVICPDAAWDMIKDTFESKEVIRKFYIDKGSFFLINTDFDTVSK